MTRATQQAIFHQDMDCVVHNDAEGERAHHSRCEGDLADREPPDAKGGKDRHQVRVRGPINPASLTSRRETRESWGSDFAMSRNRPMQRLQTRRLATAPKTVRIIRTKGRSGSAEAA